MKNVDIKKNVNINELYHKIKKIPDIEYWNLSIKITNKGVVSFYAYVSINVDGNSSESFETPTPEELYEDIRHWISTKTRSYKTEESFNINLCSEQK